MPGDVCFPNFIIPYNSIQGEKKLADFKQARLEIAEGIAKSHNTTLTDEQKKQLDAQSEKQFSSINLPDLTLSEKDYRVFYNFAKNYDRDHNTAGTCTVGAGSFDPRNSFEVSDAAIEAYNTNLRKAFEHVAEDIQ